MSLSNKLLIIQERDVGLFSMVWQVVNTLYVLQQHKIDRTLVVVLGESSVYFHKNGHEQRKNVWEYYFEPLVTECSENDIFSILGNSVFELLESKRKQLEHFRGEIEFPEDLHRLTPLSTQDELNLVELEALVSKLDWTWTDSFYPSLDQEESSNFDIPHNIAADFVQRYIRPRTHIQRKVSKLFRERLDGYYNIIGVHVRGTDGHSAPARGIEIPFDRYFSEIENRMNEIGRHSCIILLATGEQSVISIFEEQFKDKLVYHSARRKVDSDEVFGVGPTGQVVPGYIVGGEKTATINGEDAVVEYALLCKSDFFIHNVSSLSSAVRVSVPESVSV